LGAAGGGGAWRRQGPVGGRRLMGTRMGSGCDRFGELAGASWLCVGRSDRVGRACGRRSGVCRAAACCKGTISYEDWPHFQPEKRRLAHYSSKRQARSAQTAARQRHDSGTTAARQRHDSGTTAARQPHDSGTTAARQPHDTTGDFEGSIRPFLWLRPFYAF